MKSMFPPVYLSGVSTKLGRLYPVDEILRQGDRPEDVALLIEKGMKSFSILERPLIPTIAECINGTLVLSGLKPSEIDGIIVVTESFSELSEATVLGGEIQVRMARNALFDTFLALGFERAPVYCSSFGGSSNFLQVMQLAHPLVFTGRVKQLLIVSVDCQPRDISRFMSDAIALTGDGIATCILNSDPKSSNCYEVEFVNIVPFLRVYPESTLPNKMLEMYRATKSAAADCYEATNKQPNNFSWLLLSNYNYLTSRIFSQLLGFSLEHCWLHNVPRTGHVPSCDPLINLDSLEQASLVIKGSSLMLFITGPISCGTLSLVRR